MQSKKIPIVFSFDKNYLLPAKIAIASLLDFSNKNTFYDIFLLDGGLDDYEKDFLRFNLKKQNCSITWVKFNRNLFTNVPVAPNWPETVYYRLLIPELINNYDKVIYSDVDVLFQRDLTDVYNINLDNYYWAGVIAEYNNKALCHQSFPENKNEFIYMSGFMVMNLKKMRDENIISQFFKNISKFGNRLKMFDLEILNLTCKKIKSVPINYCVLENIFSEADITKTPEYTWLSNYYSKSCLLTLKKNPFIIHYAGRDIKIWDRQETEINQPYLQYIKLFRTDYLLFKNHYKTLQVGDNDLIGDKFNGYNLHFCLKQRGIDSKQLVWNKLSRDLDVGLIAGGKLNRKFAMKRNLNIQKEYFLNSINNSTVYDILYNEWFLNTNVVHFHLIHNFIFDIQLLPIICRLKPVVWTLHDPWLFGGHCIHHFDCEKWKKQCGDCPYLDRPFKMEKDNSALNFEIKKMAIQNSDFDVIVASEWMKRKAEQSLILKGKRIHLIPFGIDCNIFKPMDKNTVRDELGIPRDAVVLTFRCDYSGFKGMDYIQYVVDHLKTNKKVYFLLLKEKLKNKNKKFFYKEFGWVKDDLFLSKIYNASDLFLSPSSAESFGMMPVEAMCCGVLPIVLKGTALSKTINAPTCGVSVEKIKKEYLKVVDYYIKHNNQRRKKAKKCLNYAISKYDMNIYMDKVTEVYKIAIRNHKLDKSYAYLLTQLKKFMMVDSSLKVISLKRFLEKEIKKRVKDYILIVFYRVDKIFPRKIRKKIKKKLIRFSFVKKYLIKKD